MKPEFTVDASLINQVGAAGEAGKSVTRPVGGVAKRVFDLAAASVGLLILTPIMVVVALLIWTHDGKSPVFAHWRIGRGGRLFRCLKFRSMVPNSSDVLATLLKVDQAASREWRDTQKLHNDPRITPLGRVLRSSSLDELPQLLNVLKGEMSIVGPRPIVQDEIERYGSEFDKYCACKPGLTGLWQVSGRSDCSYGDRIGYDCAYAKTWSIWLDLQIVVRTIPAVLKRKGSY